MDLNPDYFYRISIGMNKKRAAESERQHDTPNWISLVSQKVRALQFGSVLITVHEGKVTQIESAEKIRIQSDSPTRPNS